jgi:drug/metabolite transporter (DMT)-like permease
MTSRPRPAVMFTSLALNVLIASGTFLVAKSALGEFPPLVLALLRFTLATALLWPIVRIFRPGVRIAREDRPRIWLLGLLAVPLNQGLFLIGMQWASASHAALLYALTPAFVVLILAVQSRTRPALAQLAGIAVAFVGVLLLLFQRGLHFDRHSVRGDVLVFLAVIAWAAYLVAGRSITRRYGPLVVTSESLLAGTVMYLPIGLVALVRFHPATISGTGWLGLFYLAWLTSVLNYVLWFWALQHLKAATVAMLTNLQPIVAAAMAWVFLREVLPAGFLLSTLLVLAGVWLTRLGAESIGPEPPTAGAAAAK